MKLLVNYIILLSLVTASLPTQADDDANFDYDLETTEAESDIDPNDPNLTAGDEDLPDLEYEKCDCTNERYTKGITDQFLTTSFDSLVNCNCTPLSIIKSPLSLLSEIVSTTQLPANCYLASMLLREKRIARRGFRMCVPTGNAVKTNYFQSESFPTPECKSVNGKTAATVRAPCINKDYVQMTKDSFEATMKCFDINPRDVYPVINHESRFLLNSVSPTGASCYGQLTSGLISDLNRTDEITNLSFKDKCPKVAKLFKEVKTIDTPYKDSAGKQRLRTKLEGTEAICNLAENPISCMVYTALAHKKNLEKVHKNSTDNPVYIVKSGSKKMFFSTIDSAKKVGAERATELFADTKQVEELVVTWSYNGGAGGINDLYSSFLRSLRTELVNSAANSPLRTEFNANGGITTQTFYKRFSDYIRNNYKWVNRSASAAKQQARRNEVANYVKKIRNELEVVEKKVSVTGHACSDRNSFLSKVGAE